MPPFASPEPVRREGWPVRLLLLGGVIAALYVGRDVLTPLALALLLTIGCLPAVDWLERRGLPRIPVVLLVLLIMVCLLLGLAYVVTTQALALAAELPGYETILRAKLDSLNQGSGPIQGVLLLMNRLGSGLAPQQTPLPMVVTLESSPGGPLSALAQYANIIIAPFAMILITLLLMAFILVQRENVRDRALRLAGLHEMHRTTGAMAEATARVGRYLLMQALMNALFGLAMGTGLWLLGVPQAPLWGAMGFALRFVPYLGAPLSVMFPLLLAFATTDGWTTVILVMALFASVVVLLSYVLEPWLYGASTGISPLALLLASAFWALLWGPMGLILAPAMTACLVILGRHVESLAFFDILLGDSEPLPVDARFYQRILAEDTRGARSLLAFEANRMGARTALEQLVLPAIEQIGSDRPSQDFGAALAIRAARTLLRVLEAQRDAEGETLHGPADILILPLAGALDQALGAAIQGALVDAGHAASLLREEVTTPVLVVLVAAMPAAAHRMARSLADARALGGMLVGFTVSEAAEDQFHRAGLESQTLTSLLEENFGREAPLPV